MKRNHQETRIKMPRWLNLFVIAGVLCLSSAAGVWADGTPAGTDINNMATINYTVGGGSAITIESSPTGNNIIGAGSGTVTMFEVDRKIDLTVARVGVASVAVPAGGQDQVLVFTVSNTGNDTQDFNLDAVNFAVDPFGGAENLDVTIDGVFVDSDGPGPIATYVPGAHSYDGADTATVIDNLGPDQMINVYVRCDIPTTATNGQIAALRMRATALTAAGAALTNDDEGTAWDAATVQTVWTDGAGVDDAVEDRMHSDNHSFIIQAAALTVTKTSAIVWDPVNTSNYKAIPGAFIEYTVTIANAAGAATATGVAITDSLDTMITSGYVAFLPDSYAAGFGLRLTAPSTGNVQTNLSNGADADAGDWNVTAVNTVTVNCGDLAAGESATVTFQLEVQ